MNSLAHSPDELTIRTSGGRFVVQLASRGNPDHRQNPRRPLPGVPDVLAHVGSLAEARDLCLQYIRFFELGSGNWTGGQVVQADGLVVGRFSYNGRLWKDADGREEVCVS